MSRNEGFNLLLAPSLVVAEGLVLLRIVLRLQLSRLPVPHQWQHLVLHRRLRLRRQVVLVSLELERLHRLRFFICPSWVKVRVRVVVAEERHRLPPHIGQALLGRRGLLLVQDFILVLVGELVELLFFLGNVQLSFD